MKSVAAATLLAATLVHPAAAVFKPVASTALKTAVDACLAESGTGDCTTLAGTTVLEGQGSDTYGPIGDWDVSQVEDMKDLFNSYIFFNQDISKWDVSRVTNMNDMFKSARVFNQDLSSWDVSEVKNMKGMFETALKFNQDLSSWNVGKVENMDYMFYITEKFSQTLCGQAWVDSTADRSNFNGGTSSAQISATACTACDNTDGTAINSGQLHDKCICGGTAYCSSGTGLVCDATTDTENPICSKPPECAASEFRLDGDLKCRNAAAAAEVLVQRAPDKLAEAYAKAHEAGDCKE